MKDLTRRDALKLGAAAGLASALNISPWAQRILAAGTYPSLWVEAQDWWNGPVGGGTPDQVPFPYRHVHGRFNIPWNDELHPVSGTVDVPFQAFTHGNVGVIDRAKWQDDVGDAARTQVIKLGVPCSNTDLTTGTFHLDTTKEADGWRLWRFYVVVKHPNGNQQVARPRFRVFVNNGKGRTDVGSAEGPTGWYKEASGFNWGYNLASIKGRSAYHPFTPIPHPWSVPLQTSDNGGPTPDGYSVHVDPDFHNGNVGHVIASGAGLLNSSVTVDPTALGLAAGTHKLAIRSLQDAHGDHHEGVGVYLFTV